MTPIHPDELERRLRAAAAFAPEPPARLRGRILDAVRASERVPDPATPLAIVPVPRARWGNRVAAAAALLALASAWWLARITPERAPDAQVVVAFSQDLLGAGSTVLALPARAGLGLRTEAEALLADTSRIAADVVRGLPAPLRGRL